MDDFITAALPTQALVEEEKSPEQKTIEYEQTQEDYLLAALVDHPGWEELKKQILQDIDDFKSFKNIEMQKYDDDQLGRVVRTERMVAEKLELYLTKIDNAAQAIASRNG